ncbi:MAG: Ig-like domain-containing protein, partial [Anaerolineales bacterium]|nr:Ig-like domain-containing protein [Anaerolineales bacterium]
MSDLTPGSMKTRNKFIFGLPLILLMVSLACALPFTGTSKPTDNLATQVASPTPLPEPTPTQRVLPPALVEIDPPPGVELALDGAIRLYFNQPMDQASVESAFQSDAIPSAEFDWLDDATLMIRSAERFSPSTSLAFEIETSARSAQGQNLLKTISLGYQTVSPLKLIQKLPEQGSQQVNPASAIVAAFNQPVVPLGADQADLPAAFSLDPPAGGRGEWINTSTYIFYPQPDLSGGVNYQVTVDPQLKTSTGAALENSESWQFSTALPRVERVSPALGSPAIDLDEPIVFTFNQAMDPDSVEASFRLEDPAGNSIPGGFTWTAEKNEFTWQPANTLARDTIYNLRLEAGARSQGGAPLATDYRASILSIPELRVVSSKPAPGGRVDPYSGLSLRFSGPIEAKNLSQILRFEPRVSGVSTYWDQTERALYISGYFEPSTDYRLVVSPALKDPWGSSIGGTSGAEYTLAFRTLPLRPSVLVGVGYEPQFLTGQDRAVAAQVSGFSSLPLSVGSVPVMDFVRMQGQNGYEIRRNYQPADVRTWKQTIEGNPDRAQETEIYLSPEQTPLPTGVYLLAIDTSQEAKSIQQFLIVVSNIHLALKVSATDALAWAVNLQSGNPLEGAPITLYAADGTVLASGITDDQGLFYSTIPDRPNIYEAITALIGQPGEDLFAAALSTWNQDIDPWSFDLPTDYQGSRTRAYLYSDRPIYRPGQTVYFRGIVRKAYNGRYQIPALNEVKVQFFDDQGQEVNTFNLPLSIYGTFHSQLELPSNLRPGSYSLSIPDLDYSYLSIPVADYRKPEIDLQAAFDTAEVTAGEMLQAVVKARYFFDAPAGNLPVNWTLTRKLATFDLPGYSVGLHGAETWYSNPGWVDPQVDSGAGITAPDGGLSLELGPAEAGSARQEFTLEVTAEDESGLPVSTRTAVLVNPSDTFIGVRSEQWTGRADEPFGFEVKTVRPDQSPAGMISLRAEFSQVSWVIDSSQPNNPFTGPAYRPEYTPVASTDLLTGADGLARLEFTPPDPGIYQLDVFSLPANGPETRTEIIAWVGGAGQFTFPSLDNRHIELTADQTDYQPGEEAQVFIPNPFPTSAQALVTIERGKILRYSIQILEPGGSIFSVSLSDEDAPNIYVSVTLLGRDGQNQIDFRQGYINLPVEPRAQTLNIQVTGQPEVAGPGETVEFELLVTDSQGAPVQGEFSLAMVDLAALALAGPNSEEIVPAFYDIQPIGVRTGIPLAVYAARNVEQIAGRGGGGGDGSGTPTVRERFPDTAFWQADLITDAAGKARVSLVLPDNLTTWWIESRGLTTDTQVGQASTEIVTTKELLVRPVTPRFLVAGDRVELAAVVQNNTSQEISGEAALLAEGVSLEDPSAARQKFSLPADGRIRLN